MCFLRVKQRGIKVNIYAKKNGARGRKKREDSAQKTAWLTFAPNTLYNETRVKFRQEGCLNELQNVGTERAESERSGPWLDRKSVV